MKNIKFLCQVQMGLAYLEKLVGYPYVGATETFLSFNCFNTINESKNLIKYIKTKFARALLGSLKVTQGNKKQVFGQMYLFKILQTSPILIGVNLFQKLTNNFMKNII